jgi:hypothetical protein
VFDADRCNTPKPADAHRKIPVYWNFMDKLDDAGVSHGSHCAGSVAGYVDPTEALAGAYNGGAPQARLVFVDMAADPTGDLLAIPPDLPLNYFPFFVQNDARITSQSWGSNSFCSAGGTVLSSSDPSDPTDRQCGVYTPTSREIDEFAARTNTELLAVFAAGNDGDQGFFSITDEACAKNALVVGASRTTFDHMMSNVAPYEARNRVDAFCQRYANPDVNNWNEELCAAVVAINPWNYTDCVQVAEAERGLHT